jgi:hypothetical protein
MGSFKNELRFVLTTRHFFDRMWAFISEMFTEIRISSLGAHTPQVFLRCVAIGRELRALYMKKKKGYLFAAILVSVTRTFLKLHNWDTRLNLYVCS